MGKQCFLCKNSSKVNVSLHRFPKKENVRREWMRVCGLCDGIDNVTTLFLCSCHFLPKDFMLPLNQELSKKQFLKPNTIPSLRLPGGVFEEKSEQKIEENLENLMQVDIKENPENFMQTNIKKTRESSTQVDIKENRENFMQETLTYSSSSKSVYEADVKDIVDIPKKGIYDPRYVGDVSLHHVSTPRRAKRVLQMIKRTDTIKSNKIRVLQNRIGRLMKKIDNLQQLVKYLQKKNLISEDGRNSLMDMLPESKKHVINRKVKRKGKYSSDI